MERRVRVDLGLEQPPEPGSVEFGGVHITSDMALDLYWAWKDHHALAVSGGYLDQPEWWHTLMRRLDLLYYWYWWLHKDKVTKPQG